MITTMKPHQIALTTAIVALRQRLSKVLGERFTGTVGISFHVQDGRLNTLKATSKGGLGAGACSPQLVEAAVKVMSPLIHEAIDAGLTGKFFGVVAANYEFKDGSIVNQSICTEQIVKLTV